ncbi:MAG: LecA/PA-IL family lectin [Vicinamibacterales bacterium]
MTRHSAALVAAFVLAGVALQADTLVLRDGRRVQGELVAVRDGVIEFEGQRGVFGRELVRVDREDVLRIELDGVGGGSGSRYDSDRGNGRDDRNSTRDDRGITDTRPSGMRERSISVEASQPWTDTGVSLRSGQTIYVEAAGRVRWGPGRQDGPAGERNSPRNEGRPMPNRSAGALIGRVGESDGLFLIADETGPIRVRDGGRLYLGVNDDYLQDNSGSFRVTIYY